MDVESVRRMTANAPKVAKLQPGMFRVSRYSCWIGKLEQPCDGSEFCRLLVVERMKETHPFDAPNGVEGWYREGENHRIEDGCICRDMYVPMWLVVIEDLLEFVRKEGDRTISIEDGIPTIEIISTDDE